MSTSTFNSTLPGALQMDEDEVTVARELINSVGDEDINMDDPSGYTQALVPYVAPDLPHRRNAHTNDSKRVAVAGPSQRTFDDMRVQKENARQKAAEQTMRMRQQQKELDVLRQKQRESDARHRANVHNEAQMMEQILQYERRFTEMSGANNELVQLMQQSKQQMDDMAKRCEEMDKALNELRSEKERDKTTHENEIMRLRQRLQKAEEQPPTPAAPSTSSSPISSRPRQGKTQVVQGARSSIGIVPLRPSGTTSSPEGLGGVSSTTDTPPTAPGTSATSSTSAAATGSGSPSTVPGSSPAIPFGIDMNKPESMRDLVKELIGQLKADVSVLEPTKSQLSKRRRVSRESARAKNRQAILDQQAKMPKIQDLSWKETVRRFWKTQFDVSSVKDFAQYEPASSEDVEAFKEGQNGPDTENKVLDFGRGWEKSRWNKVILNDLVKGLRKEEANDGSWNLIKVSDDYLFSLFHNQLKQSRENWRLVQHRPNVEEGRMETDAEVAERVGDYCAARLTLVGSRSRKERKHERRTTTVEKVITFKIAAKEADLATWLYFRDLLVKLNVDGMSSEEEGATEIGELHVPVFRVKVCTWRSPAIVEYLKYIDKASQDSAIRSSRGHHLLPRVLTGEPGLAPAPHNLPRSLYDEEWLRKEEEVKGKQWIEEELCISKEVFELLRFSA